MINVIYYYLVLFIIYLKYLNFYYLFILYNFIHIFHNSKFLLNFSIFKIARIIYKHFIKLNTLRIKT